MFDYSGVYRYHRDFGVTFYGGFYPMVFGVEILSPYSSIYGATLIENLDVENAI